MTKYEIKSYVSVGNINFGEERASVRSKNEEYEYKEFKKSKFSKNTTDDFSVFHVFYDKDNKVNAVEFFENVYMNNIDLFSKTYEELKNIFSDSTCEEDDCGIIFKKYGFSLYSPDKKTIESVLVFKKGYFD